MAPEMGYEPRTYNDKSALSDGWKPAFLLAISDEETPATWKMYAQSPRLWRWHFAVWEVPTLIDRHAPERQSAPSSQKFTPKGNQPASKAYAWTSALLQRQIQPGERVNLDPMMPLPCRVKISRNGEYANIIDVEAWGEGTHYLTQVVRDGLRQLLQDQRPPANGHAGPPAAAQPAPVSPPPGQSPGQAPAPAPGMQTWGGQPAQPVRASTKPSW